MHVISVWIEIQNDTLMQWLLATQYGVMEFNISEQVSKISKIDDNEYSFFHIVGIIYREIWTE